FPRFVARRALRLEPPYITSILLVIALWHASAAVPIFSGATPNYSFPQVAAHLLYAVPLTEYSWLQPVYWTLAYEFVFYLLIGVSFPWMNLRDRPYPWLALSAAVLAGVVAGVLPGPSPLFLLGIMAFQQIAGKLGGVDSAALVAFGIATVGV